ncbi:hypothetical protein MTO96_009963 [Rhipicephalus appendiculatus]
MGSVDGARSDSISVNEGKNDDPPPARRVPVRGRRVRLRRSVASSLSDWPRAPVFRADGGPFWLPLSRPLARLLTSLPGGAGVVLVTYTLARGDLRRPRRGS